MSKLNQKSETEENEEKDLRKKKRLSVIKYVRERLEPEHRNYCFTTDTTLFMRVIKGEELLYEKIPLIEQDKAIIEFDHYIDMFKEIVAKITEQEMIDHEVWKLKTGFNENKDAVKMAEKWKSVLFKKVRA